MIMIIISNNYEPFFILPRLVGPDPLPALFYLFVSRSLRGETSLRLNPSVGHLAPLMSRISASQGAPRRLLTA
jgi:hypothetical protein